MHKSFRFWLAIGISVAFLGPLCFHAWTSAKPGRYWERQTTLRSSRPSWSTSAPSLFRTLRWQYLLAPVKSLEVRRLYPVVVVGYMANNILPVRLGEVVRAYYVGEREKVSKVAALATIAVERVFDGLTLLFFAAVVGLFLPVGGAFAGACGEGGNTLGAAGPGYVIAVCRRTPLHDSRSILASLVLDPD